MLAAKGHSTEFPLEGKRIHKMLFLQGLEWQAAHQAETLSFQAEQAAAKAARQDEMTAKAAEADASRQAQLFAWSAQDSARQVRLCLSA